MADCIVDLKPMKEWVEGQSKKGECRPCLLGPVVQWYKAELVDYDKLDLASKLEKMGEDKSLTPLQISEELDSIKATVEEPLRERLKEFDCAVQSYDEEDNN